MHTRRARDLGVVIGRYPPGERNAITDVRGVRVGHATVVREDTSGVTGSKAVRTGVTAIWPHAGEPWRDRVYVGTFILNGYGEIIGINQLNEWGVLHSPVVLTSSLSIGLAYDATARWIAAHDPAQGTDDVFMPVVTECDDSFLNDVRSFPLSDRDVVRALEGATDGDINEGCVGAATGLQCFDFKGGIGTASRVLPADSGGFTVGALVSTNFGARPDLVIAGVPVGLEITDLMPEEHSEGSCVVVVATDAPLLPHQLRRLALRAGMALARAGSIGANGSGELMLAFSTAQTVPREAHGSELRARAVLDGAYWHHPSPFDPLFFLLDHVSALDNVATGLLYQGLPAGARRRQASAALERVGLAGRLHHKAQHLSGGERQRVAIARAIVGGPVVVLADEPTGNLDSTTGKEILALLAELNDDGVTIVVITHDAQVAGAARRHVRLHDGRVTSDEITSDPRSGP